MARGMVTEQKRKRRTKKEEKRKDENGRRTRHERMDETKERGDGRGGSRTKTKRGMKVTTAKEWINGKTERIVISIKKGKGKGESRMEKGGRDTNKKWKNRQ